MKLHINDILTTFKNSTTRKTCRHAIEKFTAEGGCITDTGCCLKQNNAVKKTLEDATCTAEDINAFCNNHGITPHLVDLFPYPYVPNHNRLLTKEGQILQEISVQLEMQRDFNSITTEKNFQEFKDKLRNELKQYEQPIKTAIAANIDFVVNMVQGTASMMINAIIQPVMTIFRMLKVARNAATFFYNNPLITPIIYVAIPALSRLKTFFETVAYVTTGANNLIEVMSSLSSQTLRIINQNPTVTSAQDADTATTSNVFAAAISTIKSVINQINPQLFWGISVLFSLSVAILKSKSVANNYSLQFKEKSQKLAKCFEKAFHIYQQRLFKKSEDFKNVSVSAEYLTSVEPNISNMMVSHIFRDQAEKICLKTLQDVRSECISDNPKSGREALMTVKRLRKNNSCFCPTENVNSHNETDTDAHNETGTDDNSLNKSMPVQTVSEVLADLIDQNSITDIKKIGLEVEDDKVFAREISLVLAIYKACSLYGTPGLLCCAEDTHNMPDLKPNERFTNFQIETYFRNKLNGSKTIKLPIKLLNDVCQRQEKITEIFIKLTNFHYVDTQTIIRMFKLHFNIPQCILPDEKILILCEQQVQASALTLTNVLDVFQHLAILEEEQSEDSEDSEDLYHDSATDFPDSSTGEHGEHEVDSKVDSKVDSEDSEDFYDSEDSEDSQDFYD